MIGLQNNFYSFPQMADSEKCRELTGGSASL